MRKLVGHELFRGGGQFCLPRKLCADIILHHLVHECLSLVGIIPAKVQEGNLRRLGNRTSGLHL